MTVGERIAARRKELNMTQDGLARKLGYKSRSSINKIELSLSKVPLSKLERIADALDCEAAYLMGWSESPDLVSLARQAAEHQRLIELWDRADEIDRNTIWSILSRYDEKGAGSSASAG